MSLEFNNLTDEYKKCIERYLDNECFCNYNNEPQSLLFDAMRYSLLAGGKRLRPIFVFDFCRMCCSEWERALPFAAAVEMIHTYSLIHDDLPCMDNDDYRRGRLTNHKVYGEAIAVLSGDALLTAAFKYIASASFSADVRIQAVDIIAECAGEIGMVGGQVLDMQAEQTDCTEQNILAIQSRKTGALIRAACMLGVLAGNGTPEQLSAASEFAYYIGLAFQIRDDILDVIGSVEDLGKSVASDKNKATFVQLYGIDKCVALVHSLTDKALKSLNVFHDNKYMSYLALQLTERNI